MFGLGAIYQVVVLFDNKFKKEDAAEILKDIGGGLLFIMIIFLLPDGKDEINLYAIIPPSVYMFILGFGAAFAFSFKQKLLIKTNEINLLALNLLFLYYSVSRLGFENWLTTIAYLLTLIIFVSVLFKNKLKNIHKGILYLWFHMLFMIFGIISVFQTKGDLSDIYSSYASSFLKGGILLNIWIYLVVCLVLYVNIIDSFYERSRFDIKKGRMTLKKGFSDLVNSFEITRAKNSTIIILFILLFSFLMLNYYNNYISESLLIVIILFLASFSSAKRIESENKTHDK